MVLVSLVFLFVYLFGAYAYGAATVYGFRDIGPVWGGHYQESASGRTGPDKPGLALFAISTVWFVLHCLIEFRNLTRSRRPSRSPTAPARSSWPTG